nr:hypothetical protein [Mesorhizobium loti]
MDGQRRSRLIHYEQLGAARDRLEDLDHLPLGEGQIAHTRGRIEREGVPLDQSLGIANHFSGVDAQAEGERLAKDEQVFGNRAVRQDTQFLEDHCDAAVDPLAKRQGGDVLSGEQNAAFVRSIGSHEDLHERRFARTILAEQRVRFTGHDLERNIGQNTVRAKRLADALHRYDRVPGR